jgi:hypothetical protein
MAGGPVSGAPWSLRGNQNDPKNFTRPIIVPTAVQMAADALRYWTSMTCIYDKHWSADPDKVTLPICMFHVKKIVPTYVNEVSKKRVILYEPQKYGQLPIGDTINPLRGGIMQTIVDNIVKQPTTYNAEVIVPFQPIGRYVAQGVKGISDIVMAFSDIFGSGKSGGFGDWWGSIFSTVFSVVKTANQASQIAGMLPNMNGVSYINVNSLEAMAESGRLLCMKMWTGYDYKFVTITGLTLDKQPLEDDVYRATLTMQEMPVLVVTKPKTLLPPDISRNWAVTAISAVQGALVTPLIAITGVKKAASGGASGVEMIKAVTGG